MVKNLQITLVFTKSAGKKINRKKLNLGLLGLCINKDIGFGDRTSIYPPIFLELSHFTENGSLSNYN